MVKEIVTAVFRGRSALSVAVLVGTCLVSTVSTARAATTIQCVAAENQYGSVISQLGGHYVSVTSILSNPNTDPHLFEASPRVAEEIANARIVVQNGLGYDSFMNKIEDASPNKARDVVVAQTVLGLPDSTSNPHLWYSPSTMPAVAKVIERDLVAIAPSHAAFFEKNLATFDSQVSLWVKQIDAFKAKKLHATAAVTEPVADYLLSAMGIKIVTPFVFQADIMNGVDPSPEDISLEQNLLRHHRVTVFCYNEQVVDSLTGSLKQDATAAKVPVVGVYETMPAELTYQNWMLYETLALVRAVEHGTSSSYL